MGWNIDGGSFFGIMTSMIQKLRSSKTTVRCIFEKMGLNSSQTPISGFKSFCLDQAVEVVETSEVIKLKEYRKHPKVKVLQKKMVIPSLEPAFWHLFAECYWSLYFSSWLIFSAVFVFFSSPKASHISLLWHQSMQNISQYFYRVTSYIGKNVHLDLDGIDEVGSFRHKSAETSRKTIRICKFRYFTQSSLYYYSL